MATTTYPRQSVAASPYSSEQPSSLPALTRAGVARSAQSSASTAPSQPPLPSPISFPSGSPPVGRPAKKKAAEKQERKQGTRATKATSAINAEVSKINSERLGMRDALDELRADAEEEEEEPKILNSHGTDENRYASDSRYAYEEARSSFIPSVVFYLLWTAIALASIWIARRVAPWLWFLSALGLAVHGFLKVLPRIRTLPWLHLAFHALAVVGAISLGFAIAYLVQFAVLCSCMAGVYYSRKTIIRLHDTEYLSKLMVRKANAALFMTLPFELDMVTHTNYHRPVRRLLQARLLCAAMWLTQNFASFETQSPIHLTHIFISSNYGLHPTTTSDQRLSNQRANAAVDDQLWLSSYLMVNVKTGRVTRIACCDEVVNQVAVRLRSIPAADRKLQAEPLAQRVTNLMCFGKWFADVAFGSSIMATVNCRAKDLKLLAFDSARHAMSDSSQLVVGLLPLLSALALASPTPAAFLPPQYWWFEVIVLTPIVEEGLKSLLSFLLGIPKPWVSLAFGIIEWDFRDYTISGVPAFVLHACVGFLSFKKALTAHVIFNWFVIAAVTYLRELAAQKLRALSVALDSVSWEDLSEECRKYQDFTKFSLICAPRIGWESYCKWCDSMIPFAPSQCFTVCLGQVPASMPGVALMSACAAVLGFGPIKLGLRRLHAIGYRVGEVPLPPMPGATQHGAKVRMYPTFFAPCVRRTVSSTLGFALRFIAPVCADFNHGLTVLHGCLTRFCSNPPKYNPAKVRRLRKFVRRYVRSHYVPIPSDADVSVATWLEGTHYTEARKRELIEAWMRYECLIPGDTDNAGFAKRESYLDYKPARGINSRSDRFKCATGPFFKLMEEQVYYQPCYVNGVLSTDPTSMTPFIKHIPVHLRPQFITSYLGDYPGRYYETDYEKFERHFVPEVMDSIEMILYHHMLRNFPSAYQLIRGTMCGMNRCKYKTFSISVRGRRMSGEMCTSLGNGFSNLMLFKFAAHEHGGDAVGVVEGDDALFYSSVELTKEDFAELGFTIKILVHSDLCRTAFCGMMMSRTLNLLRDPRKVLLKFGWSHSPHRDSKESVRMGLLKAKALSLAYECPKCPIIHALAKRVLQVTSGFTPKFDNSHWGLDMKRWTMQFSAETQLKLREGPGEPDRLDFAEVFGIPIPLQMEIERRIMQWDGQPLYDPLIHSLFEHDTCRDYSYRYTAESETLAMGLMGDL